MEKNFLKAISVVVIFCLLASASISGSMIETTQHNFEEKKIYRHQS